MSKFLKFHLSTFFLDLHVKMSKDKHFKSPEKNIFIMVCKLMIQERNLIFFYTLV